MDTENSDQLKTNANALNDQCETNILPTESPPIQVMERTECSDPNRTPASATSMDWSIASTGSLFSIRIGNDSFSKDHALRMSRDMHRSGELPVSGELLKSGELYQSREFCGSGELYQSGELHKSDDQKRSGELNGLGQTLPAAKGVEPNENMGTFKDISEDMKPETKAVIDEANCDVPQACINIQSGTKLSESSNPCNANHNSGGKKICIQGFVSPSKKMPPWPLCHCLCSSSWMCRFHKWPSCCCKLSGCSSKWFHWPSCSSDCLRWPSCSCNWANCCNCKWLSGHFRCPMWSSCCCKCHGSSNFSCSCCYSWSRETKRPRSESFYTLMEGA